AIVSFNQARIIINDVFVTNFFRVFYALIGLTIVSLIKTEFLESFKKENRKILKFYFYIAIAGILSLGLADTLFYKAAEINGLVLTSTITVNTPMVQQIFSILILKEKFRKRFLIAVALIIIGNYIILFF
ncbi:MAG: EamA family transporter, partial [Promethearchaeota archaeon]